MILIKNIYWHAYWEIERLWKEFPFTWKEDWAGEDTWEGSRVGKSSCNTRYMRETCR